MSGQGFYGFPNILGLLRATNLKVLGKAGATAGAGLAGGTTSGAPTSGQFDVGEAVIAQDGSLWICTASGSPGTFVQAGFANPLTTRGDLLVQGASSTTRLALGTTNYVLTSNGTDAVWALSPASAGGAASQIYDTTLGATAASVDITGIAGTHKHLRLVALVRGTNASQQGVRLRLNGDSGSNYDWSFIRNAASVASASANSAQTQAYVCDAAPSSSDAAGVAAPIALDLPHYAGTTFYKYAHGTSVRMVSGTTPYTQAVGVQWRSTAAITQITLSLDAGNFDVGTRVTLYAYD